MKNYRFRNSIEWSVAVISKCIFILAHLVAKPRVLWFYYMLRKSEYCSKLELADRQRRDLTKYLSFCRREIPLYASKIPKFKIELKKEQFQSMINDIPYLTKEDIINNRSYIELPIKRIGGFKYCQTGGSTGDPLKYRISKKCMDLSFAMLYRGLARGGYKLGDSLAVMAGGSLVTKKKSIKTKLVSFLMNTRGYSSYGVSDALFQEYYEDLIQWRPKFIRGYASSLYELAKFVDRNQYNLTFESVFTTAEMLFEHQRKIIEKVFNSKVFNGYGLNDSGITAFECEMHDGFHIDLERSYLEVVDDTGKLVFDQAGQIVGTSFHNKATPFVRYVTGDLGILSSKECACGSPYPLLKNLMGRTTDILRVNDSIIGGPVLTVLMANVAAVRYQFIQFSKNRVMVIIEKAAKYGDADEEFIRASLFSNVGKFNLEFVYDVSAFEYVDGGKHKIVINKIK